MGQIDMQTVKHMGGQQLGLMFPHHGGGGINVIR